MIKVIQKYRQYMLVAFGVVLMIAFIVPQAGHMFGGDPMSRKVATVNGSSVTAAEMARAHQEYDTIRTLLDPLGMPKSIDLAKELFGAENDRHWLLLSRAAQNGGFMSTPADAAVFEKDIRDSILVPLIARSGALSQYPSLAQQPQILNMIAGSLMRDPDQLKKIEAEADKRMQVLMGYAARGAHGSPTDLQTTFARANSIGRMQTAWREAHRVSDKRATFEADRQGEILYVDQILLLAKSIAPMAPKPSEATLQQLFEKYRNVRAGTGDHGFGYQFPARVKFEWMTINRAAIAASVQLDPVEVNKYWRQNKDKYTGTFADEKTRVETDLRNQRVDTILTAIDKAVKADTIRLMGKVDTRAGYRVLPSDWATRMPRFEKLAQMCVTDVKEAAGVTIPLPQVNVRDDQFLTRIEVANIPGLGAAKVQQGTKQFSLPEVLFRSKELVGSDPDVSVQVGVPFDSYAADPEGNRYYFMVLDARRSESPKSLDEVRAKVELDAQALEQFDKLAAQVELYKTIAISDGLEAVGKYFQDTFPGAPAPALRRKLQVNLNTIQGGDSTFNQPAYREALVAAAKALDPTKPMIDFPADKRTVAVALDRPLTVVVGQMIGRAPVSVERMRTEGDYFTASYSNRELPNSALKTAFGFPALKERMKYIDLLKTSDDSQDSSAAKPDSKPKPADEPEEMTESGEPGTN
ncbi:MAG: hypothetical protein U0573_14565 [Phycisphaerales bacterium]|nr:hypothetical protein [Planctomycetota bacterium]